jgi:hypothetical protein
LKENKILRTPILKRKWCDKKQMKRNSFSETIP